MELDHINLDTLDNRRCNVRFCTHQQNQINQPLQKNNTSGVSGVSYYPPRKKYRARIKISQLDIHLGYYDTFQEAVQARNVGMECMFGEYGRYNNVPAAPIWIRSKVIEKCKRFVIMFQYWDDAQKVMTALKPRLAKFSLELAEEKTRIFKFGRFAENKEEFDFLGFTFFNTHTAKGKYRVGIRTSKKKLKAKRQKAKEWLKTRLNKNVTETMKLIRVSLLGHYNYYGVNGNYTQMRKFYEYLKYVTHKMLNRRSERAYMRWGKFNKIWDYHIPKPKITKNIWNWSVKIV